MTHWTLHGERERQAACAAIQAAPPLWRVEVREPRRTDEQSAAMWAKIDDIMKQKPGWFGPGLDKDDIKQVFMSALFKELRMARNADGDGYVPVSHRSSALSYKQMGELLTLINAWGAREGVIWTDPESKRSAA